MPNQHMKDSQKHNSFVWWSTHETARSGTHSVLAWIETAVAVSLAVWFGVRSGFWAHIVIGAAVAPLLLLSTDESRRIAIQLARKGLLGEKVEAGGERRDPGTTSVDAGMQTFLAVLPLILGMATGGLLWELWMSNLEMIRDDFPAWLGMLTCVGFGGAFGGVGAAGAIYQTYAVMSVLKRDPAQCFSAIPGNWRRYAFCMDMHSVPETITGAEEFAGVSRFRDLFLNIVKLLTFIGDVRIWYHRDQNETLSRYLVRAIGMSVSGIFLTCVITICTIVLIFPVFAIALAFRWSLKSTTIVWLPLMWLAGGVVRLPEPFQKEPSQNDIVSRLERFKQSDFSRRYSVFVIIVYGAFPVAMASTTNWLLAEVGSGSMLGRILDHFLIIATVELWDLARLLCAVITLIMSLIASNLYRRSYLSPAYLRSPSLHSWDLRMTILGYVRGFLAVYVGVCNLSFFKSLAGALEWVSLPEFGSRLFP